MQVRPPRSIGKLQDPAVKTRTKAEQAHLTTDRKKGVTFSAPTLNRDITFSVLMLNKDITFSTPTLNKDN